MQKFEWVYWKKTYGRFDQLVKHEHVQTAVHAGFPQAMFGFILPHCERMGLLGLYVLLFYRHAPGNLHGYRGQTLYLLSGSGSLETMQYFILMLPMTANLGMVGDNHNSTLDTACFLCTTAVTPVAQGIYFWVQSQTSMKQINKHILILLYLIKHLCVETGFPTPVIKQRGHFRSLSTKPFLKRRLWRSTSTRPGSGITKQSWTEAKIWNHSKIVFFI